MNHDNPPASYLSGLAAYRTGGPGAAAGEFARALAWHPSAEARAAFLVACMGQREGAAFVEEWLRWAIGQEGATPDLYTALGHELGCKGRLAEAAEVLSAATARFPSAGEAWHFLAGAQMELGRIGEATESAHRACLLDATCDRLVLFGKLLARMDRPGEAEQVFAEARRLNPADGFAAFYLGHILRLRRDKTAALVELREAVRLMPDHGPSHGELGVLHLAYFGDSEQAVACLERGVACGGAPEAICRSRLLLALHYREGIPPAEMWARHAAWDARHARLPWLAGGVDPGCLGRRIRIGYLSRDFKAHPVATFWDALGRHHDRGAFEVFCYADVGSPDDRTRRVLAHADQGVNVAGMTDEALARRIHADRLDILVDLGGHAGERMGVFAHKPAPIQVTYMGYPDTTGLRAMDFRLVDALTDPPGLTDPFCSEQLVRLPGCFLCYTPDADAPPVGEPSCAKKGVVTFASFNQFAKLSDGWAACVAAILRAVPGSRLALKSWGSGPEEAKRRAVAIFAPHGIGADRLDILGEEPTQAAHLARYHAADIALDAFPYHGTTTTCEALWMGVPVVTLAGDTHVSRVGASLLTTAGLADLVAETPEDYVAKAVALARDPARLRVLRAGLRERLHPLCDGAAFTRKVEDAYRGMCVARGATQAL